MGEYGKGGKMWGRNEEVCGGGVGDVGKYGGGVEECMR